MNAKFTLAIIALIGIGVFALPSTMSLFAGQHSFYNLDATGNQVPCQKCHGDVKAELTSNENTNPLAGPTTEGPHADFKCEYCHRIEVGASSGDNAYGKVPYFIYDSTGLNKTATRYVILTLADLEAKNMPATILVGDNATQAKARPAENGAATSKLGNVSVCLDPKTTLTSACTDPSAVMTLSETIADWKEVSAFNMTLGTPVDTNPDTMNSGLDVSKILFGPVTAATSSKAASLQADTLFGAGSRSVNPGASYHAASLVSCMECHRGEEPKGHNSFFEGDSYMPGGKVDCSNCHYGSGLAATGEGSSGRFGTLWAGGFGLTEVAADTGAVEAHNAWVKTDDGIGRFEYGANNNACVACHTHVAVDIAFNKGYKLAFTATETAEGVYSVSNAAVEGTVHVDIYGNQSGATYGVGGMSYTWTPNTELYMNGGSTVISGLNGDSSDSGSALTTP